MENSMVIPQETKYKMTIRSSKSISGYKDKKMKAGFEEIFYIYVYSSTAHNSQKVEATQVSVNRRKETQNVHNGISFSCGKEGNSNISFNMDKL